MVLRSFMLLLFVGFKFWNGKQKIVPNVWQFVLANISVQDTLLTLKYTCMWPL